MVAEDFEQDYYETDEMRDRDFMCVLVGLGWGVISIPFMFMLMLIMCGLVPALWAASILLTIYVVFILIQFKFSNDSPEGLK